MAINVNTDGAGNVYIGSQVPTKSTAQDFVDSLPTFITQMEVSNWGQGAHSNSPSVTSMSNIQLEWRPSSTHFPSETLTGTINNFNSSTALQNTGARFKINVIGGISYVKYDNSTTNIVEFSTSPTAVPTFATIAGTDIYRVVGDKFGVVSVYTKTTVNTSNFITWTGILAEPRSLFTEWGMAFARLGTRHTTTHTAASHLIKFNATAIMPILTSGGANYPIACANGSTPNSTLWATDLYLRENNPSYNNPVIGRVPNILLGRGSAFVLNNYYKLPIADQSGASTLFQCLGVWGTDFLLVRTFEEPV